MLNMLRAYIHRLRFGGGQYQCIICGKEVRKFFPFSRELQHEARKHGFPHDFRSMETLNVEQCNCPFCMSIDRERLYFIFLQEYIIKTNRPLTILDFAPSAMFSQRVRQLSGVKYESADLFRDDVDLKLDVCNMSSVRNDTYDIVICSHVLEHVDDPDLAIKEIRRILKPGGVTILMVPLFAGVGETIEDTGATTEAERYQRFGQGDHVRLFSKMDFLQRIDGQQLHVRQVTPQDLDARLVRLNAISANSILYVCSKS